MTAGSSVRYSVRILVPEPASASLDQWAVDAEGASVPQLGWHITMAPSFESWVDEDRLMGLVGSIAARNMVFSLHLTEATAVPDITRAGFSTVFLDCTDAETAHCAPVFALHDDITATLAPIRHDVQPEITARTISASCHTGTGRLRTGSQSARSVCAEGGVERYIYSPGHSAVSQRSQQHGRCGSDRAQLSPGGAPPLTEIVIAHRPSTIRNADQILVMDEGRPV